MNEKSGQETLVSDIHHLYCLPSLPTPPHAAEPNVRVRRKIVQIERERSSVRSIVPIHATKHSAARLEANTLRSMKNLNHGLITV